MLLAIKAWKRVETPHANVGPGKGVQEENRVIESIPEITGSFELDVPPISSGSSEHNNELAEAQVSSSMK